MHTQQSENAAPGYNSILQREPFEGRRHNLPAQEFLSHLMQPDSVREVTHAVVQRGWIVSQQLPKLKFPEEL